VTTTIERLNEVRHASSDECMLLGAVAGTLDALHDELLEQNGRDDAIIDAVMDALARVRPGWVRTKREWESPRITTYVSESDAERRIDEARAEAEHLRAEMATLRRIHDDALGHLAPLVGDNVGLGLACASAAEMYAHMVRERDEARAEVERLRAEAAAATAKTDDGARTDKPRVVDADGREIRVGDVVLRDDGIWGGTVSGINAAGYVYVDGRVSAAFASELRVISEPDA